jgi:hypothetical protein
MHSNKKPWKQAPGEAGTLSRRLRVLRIALRIDNELNSDQTLVICAANFRRKLRLDGVNDLRRAYSTVIVHDAAVPAIAT